MPVAILKLYSQLSPFEDVHDATHAPVTPPLANATGRFVPYGLLGTSRAGHAVSPGAAVTSLNAPCTTLSSRRPFLPRLSKFRRAQCVRREAHCDISNLRDARGVAADHACA